MSDAAWSKPLTRPAMVFAVLSLIAITAFAGVTRLVNRYGEQQKALARRMYAKGIENQKAGKPEVSIEDFRSALSYDHNNFQYQLSLARALRDTGRMSEAESYLINLWERTPQDAYVNLALGRLAARQGSVDKAIQYYHNAAYGVWPANADVNRRNAEFELIEFLLRSGAQPQAEAELIALAATLPRDPLLQIRVAQLFVQMEKFERALPLFEAAAQADRNSAPALAGAGNAALQLGRYRLADGYLRRSQAVAPQDQQSKDLLQTAVLLLQLDPYEWHLRSPERTRRIRIAFGKAGKRLDACIMSKGSDLPQGSSLADLRSQWTQMKSKLEHLNNADTDTSDAAMDLISQIEQQAQKECGNSGPDDRALLLLSARRRGTEQ